MAQQDQVNININFETSQSDKNIEKTETSLKSLRSEINQYKSDLLNLEDGTKEYSDTMDKLIERQGRLNKLNQTVRYGTLNLTDAYSAVTLSVAGVVGGFNSLLGITTLLGGETDALAETFVKLQAGMSIVQGLTSFSKSIKQARIAMIAFNSILGASPIFLLATIITGVVVAVNSLSSAVDVSTKSYNSLTSAIEASNIELERNQRLAKAAGDSERQLAQRRISQAIEIRDRIEKELKELNELPDVENNTALGIFGLIRSRKIEADRENNRKKLEEDLNAANKVLQKAQDDFNLIAISENPGEVPTSVTDSQNTYKENLEDETRLIKELQEAEDTLYSNREKRREDDIIRNFSEEEYLNYIRQQKEATDELVVSLRQRLEVTDDPEERLSILERLIPLEAEQAALQKEYLEEEAKFNADKLAFEDALAIAQGYEPGMTIDEKLEVDRAALEERINMLWKEAEDTTLSYEERRTALTAWTKAKQDADKVDKQIKDLQRKREDDQLKHTSQIFSAASSLLGEQTATGKALAVASATIDTYRAANLALATYPPPYSYAAVAATIATGLASVKAILSTKVPGGNDNSGVDDNKPNIPSFPDIEPGMIQTHNNLDAYDEAFYNESRRVYVVESDITTLQNKVELRERQSSF